MSSKTRQQQKSQGQDRHKIFITVGTTEFDQLVQYCCSEAFVELLKLCGLQHATITYQIGNTGKFVPYNANFFRLSNDIQNVYDDHDIIFTHGGAGTLLACLKSQSKNKKIVSIANTSLAGNHQTQLISKLHEEGYILGFDSVEKLKNNENKVRQFLTDTKTIKPFQSESKYLLNRLIFGQQT